MFSKLLTATVLVTSLAFVSGLRAAETPEGDVTLVTNKDPAARTTTNPVLDYLKNKFVVAYHGEYIFTRRDIESANKDDHDLQDLNIMHNPTIIYTPVKNVKFSVTSEFKYSDHPNGSYINRHYRSLVTLTRENVLEEKERGFRLDLGVARRIFDVHAGSNYGNSRLQVAVSKQVNEKFAANLLFQYLHNDPVYSKITRNTWKSGYNFLPTITYQITDKISYLFNDDFVIYTPRFNDTQESISFAHEMNVGFVTYKFNDKNSSYFQLKYYHTEDHLFETAKGSNDFFEYYIGHTYSFTPKLSVTPEVGSKIWGAHDDRFFAKDLKYPQFAFYLDYSL